MKTSKLIASISSLLFVNVITSSIGHAFSEDLCVSASSSGKVQVQNCLTAQACSRSESNTAACRANVMWDMGKATVGQGEVAARSMLHTDATYFLAQHAGFTPEAAWWIAAYDQAADQGRYTPFGTDGLPLTSWNGRPVATAGVNGFQRTSFVTAGALLHVHAPTYRANDLGYSSMSPDLENTEAEPFLNQLRSWAFQEDELCAGGFLTTDETKESTCFGHDERIVENASQVPYSLRIQQTFLAQNGQSGATVTAKAYSGEQIAAYEAVSTKRGAARSASVTNVVLASDLADWLEESYGPAAWETLQETAAGRELPRLARMGVYLHSLQDRISHHACSDASVSTHQSSKSLSEGEYVTTYATQECSQNEHAYGHFEEIGRGELGIPARTVSALQYTYRELRALALSLPSGSGLLTQKALATSAELSQTTVDALSTALSTTSGCRRVQQMLLLNSRQGYAQMPGYDASSLKASCQ